MPPVPTIVQRFIDGGVAVRLVDGDVVVSINVAVLTADPGLGKVVPAIDVYRVPLSTLEADAKAEGSRFWHRVRSWFRKKGD